MKVTLKYETGLITALTQLQIEYVFGNEGYVSFETKDTETIFQIGKLTQFYLQANGSK